MAETITALEGVILDERIQLTVTELTQVCGISFEQVHSMVSEGMLHPAGDVPEHWCFTGFEVHRTRRAVRLQQDLELNLAGAALALDLLDEVEQLRCRVRCLEHQLGRIDDAEGST